MEKKKNYTVTVDISVQKSEKMQLLNGCSGIGKHDTEVCENRPPN